MIEKPIEVRDSTGRLLGYFTPVQSPTEAEHARVAALFDLKEAARTLATERDQGRSWEQVKQHLKSLEKQG